MGLFLQIWSFLRFFIRNMGRFASLLVEISRDEVWANVAGLSIPLGPLVSLSGTNFLGVHYFFLTTIPTSAVSP